MAEIGSIIDGKYEILTKIGQGGMSQVYLAMDKRLNKQWAVKEFYKKADAANSDVVIQSLIAEANLMKKLDHPTLPRIVDIIDNGETMFVVMDYIEGQPLSRILKESGAQPQDVVIEWAKQLGEVLDYLHTRKPAIIYRDMKPGNIMLRPDGNIRLIDFGIAREYKEENIEDTTNLGTKGYAAPEQFGGKGQTDARTDIYCLGVTLYHLVTGQNPCEPPYEIYPIRDWNPTLSGGLEYIIQKCTQLNPEDRYQSCAELLYALEHYEEMDDAYRRKQKKKLRSFRIVTAMSIIFAMVGGVGQVLKVQANNSTFEAAVIQAEKSTDSVEARDLYIKAINIKPTNFQAYIDLIHRYKEDAAFTTEEEAELKKILNINTETLIKDEQYVDLAFEIGRLYWYCYDYGKTETGDNQITRIKSSIQWFEDVIEYGDESYSNYNMAKIYSDIGKFSRDITLNIEEAADKGKYSPYWTNIKELVTLIDNSPDESELVKLEVYKLTMYSIETYARKFKSDGIQQDDIKAVYEAVKESTENMETTADKTDGIKEQVISRFESTLQTIEQAYKTK